VHFVSAVLITQDAAVVRGHLLLRVLFGGQRRTVVVLHCPLQGIIAVAHHHS
jgi:hypothetical protein